jgi:histidinol-phosphate/aromatic aminotransferase/cobyric acid decarboxylase-like protein
VNKTFDLASNFNRLGVPEDLIRDLSDSLQNMTMIYAGDSMGKIDMSLAEQYFNVPTGSVTITTGSTEAFSLVIRHFAAKPIYMYSPTFWEYGFFAKEVGSSVAHITTDVDLMDTNPGLVILCNPNNPTGDLLGAETISNLAWSYPEHTFLIDETYLWFADDYRTLSAVRYIDRQPNIIVVTSLSKICAAPGLRIGLLFTANDAITKKVPYSTLPIQIEAVRFALESCKDFFRASHEEAAADRASIVRYLDATSDYEYLQPHANFVFIKAKRSGLVEHMANFGVCVRDGREFGEEYKTWIRMRLCKEGSGEWGAVMAALDTFVK